MLLFDTDVCLSLLTGNKKILELYGDSPEEIGIPSPCVQELFLLAGTSVDPEKTSELIETLLLTARVVYPDVRIARYAADIQRRLGKEGDRPSYVDVLLFSMSKVLGARLVTAHGKRYAFHVKQ